MPTKTGRLNLINVSLKKMIRQLNAADYPRLMEIWESAVRRTHHFLKEEDFLYYKERVPTYFPYVALYGAEEDGRVEGFLGVSEDNIEMLFVDADRRGQGIGRSLLGYAVEQLGMKKVDVNEQNAQAVGFYEHMGFRTVARSERDGDGKDYPLLHMRLGEE